jgi:hypothetical protein
MTVRNEEHHEVAAHMIQHVCHPIANERLSVGNGFHTLCRERTLPLVGRRRVRR